MNCPHCKSADVSLASKLDKPWGISLYFCKKCNQTYMKETV
jgi:transposase-like protein